MKPNSACRRDAGIRISICRTQNSPFPCAARRTTRSGSRTVSSRRRGNSRYEHVLTGVPRNEWDLQLEPGVCLDFVPVGEDRVLRPRLRLSRQLQRQTRRRGHQLVWPPAERVVGEARTRPGGVRPQPGTDIQLGALFPGVGGGRQLDPRFSSGSSRAQPASRPDFAQRWRDLPRQSAQQLLRAGQRRPPLRAARAFGRSSSLAPLMKNFRWSVFFRLDLESTARSFATTDQALPELTFDAHDEPLAVVHDQMFRSAVLRHRRQPGWDRIRGQRVRPAARPDRARGPTVTRPPAAQCARRPDRLGAQSGAPRPGRRLDGHAALLHRVRRSRAQRGRAHLTASRPSRFLQSLRAARTGRALD